MLDFKWIKLIRITQIAVFLVALVAALLLNTPETKGLMIAVLAVALVAVVVISMLISDKHLACPYCGCKSIFDRSFFRMRKDDVFTCPKCRKDITFKD